MKKVSIKMNYATPEVELVVLEKELCANVNASPDSIHDFMSNDLFTPEGNF